MSHSLLWSLLHNDIRHNIVYPFTEDKKQQKRFPITWFLNILVSMILICVILEGMINDQMSSCWPKGIEKIKNKKTIAICLKTELAQLPYCFKAIKNVFAYIQVFVSWSWQSQNISISQAQAQAQAVNSSEKCCSSLGVCWTTLLCLFIMCSLYTLCWSPLFGY